MLKNIMLMGNKTIELDKEKIATLYESGNTTEEISKLFSVTPPTIRRFMKKHDIEIRKSRNLLTAEQKQEAKNMRNSGMTIKEIADSFNVGDTCINSIFNKRPSNSKKTLISISETFTDYTGYKPIEIVKERNKTNSELNIYIPEKWEW
jgi:DNA invertase Pin-like site-specific DNA recombinase